MQPLLLLLPDILSSCQIPILLPNLTYQQMNPLPRLPIERQVIGPQQNRFFRFCSQINCIPTICKVCGCRKFLQLIPVVTEVHQSLLFRPTPAQFWSSTLSRVTTVAKVRSLDDRTFAQSAQDQCGRPSADSKQALHRIVYRTDEGCVVRGYAWIRFYSFWELNEGDHRVLPVPQNLSWAPFLNR